MSAADDLNPMSEASENPFGGTVDIEITDSIDLHAFAPDDVKKVFDGLRQEQERTRAHRKRCGGNCRNDASPIHALT